MKIRNCLKFILILSFCIIAVTNSAFAKEEAQWLSRLSQEGYTPEYLTMIFCDGPVYYKAFNSQKWTRALQHQTFKHGDSLRTGNHGYAVISWSADNLLFIKPKSGIRFIIQPEKIPQVAVQIHEATIMISARESGLLEIEGKHGSLVVNHGETTIQSNKNHEIIRAVKGQAAFRLTGNADPTVIPEASFLKIDPQGKEFPLANFDPQVEYDSFRRFSNWLNRFTALHQKTSLEIPFALDAVRINDQFLSNMEIDQNGFYIIDNGDGKIPEQIHLQFKITPYPRPEDRFELYVNKDLAYAIREGSFGYHEIVFTPPSIPEFFIAIHSVDSLGRKVRIFKSRFTVLNQQKKRAIARNFIKELEQAVSRRNQTWLRDNISRDYRDWQGNSYFDFIRMMEDTLRTYRDIRLNFHPFKFIFRDKKILIHGNYRLTALTNNWTFRYENLGTDILTIQLEKGSWKLRSKTAGLFFQQMDIAADLRLGLIKGRITDERTQRPLPGVTVQISGTNYQKRTDSMGEYRFYNIPPGEYSLQFYKNGYGKITATKVTVRPSGEQF